MLKKCVQQQKILFQTHLISRKTEEDCILTNQRKQLGGSESDFYDEFKASKFDWCFNFWKM